MIKKFLAGLAAMMMVASPAIAQTQPSDVPTPSVGGTVATYLPGGSNILGDGTANGGGTMPVLALQPADIPTPDALKTLWTTTGGTASVVTDPGSEIKARFQANFCLNAYDDPIRNSRAPGASHLHTFFGNCTTNSFSTFATMRNQCIALATANKVGSTASGGPINCTGYWHPTIIKTNPFSDGKNYAVIPFFYVIYYVTTPSGIHNLKKRLPRGLRYVFGVNMDDPDNCGTKNEISLANGGSGTGCVKPTTGRYRMNDSIYYGPGSDVTGSVAGGWGNGMTGYSCYNGDAIASAFPSEPVGGSGGVYESPVLKNADGSDPWPTCTGPGTIAIILDAPPCYNGKDLWVLGGYGHFRQRIKDATAGTYVCPTGWYEVPQLQIKIYARFNNAADRLSWRLSSDDMAATNSGHPCPNGCSFHTDWFGAWDDTIFYNWQKDGLGADNASPVYIMDSSTWRGSDGNRLVGGFLNEAAPDGSRNPQVWDEYSIRDTTSPSGMKLIPANKGQGPVVINARPTP